MQTIITKLVLVIAGLATGLLIFEIGTRIFAPVQKPEESILVADERGDTRHRKNIDALIFSPELKEEARFKTNREGFVGRDYALAKPDNAVRIALLGDSLLAALEVDSEKNFASLLEKNLNAKTDALEFEIMNFGVGGQGTMEEVKRYHYYVQKYNPDFVFLVFFPNDFDNNQFYLSWREAIKARDPAWKNIPLSNANNRVDRDDFKYKLLQTSRLIRWLDGTVRQNAFLERLAVKTGLHHAGAMGLPRDGIHPYFFIYQEPLEEIYKTIYDFTAELIKLLDETAAQNGSRLAVIYMPQAEQVDEKLWQEKKEKIPVFKKYDWNLNQPNDFLAGAMRNLNIDFLDLSPYFRAHYKNNPDRSLYHNRQGHLNYEGHQKTAEILEEYIINILKGR